MYKFTPLNINRVKVVTLEIASSYFALFSGFIFWFNIEKGFFYLLFSFFSGFLITICVLDVVFNQIILDYELLVISW